MSKKPLWAFTAFTVIAMILIGAIVYAQVFEGSANIMLLGILALFSEVCAVLVLWLGLLFEEEMVR